jgi:hypothetical protein
MTHLPAQPALQTIDRHVPLVIRIVSFKKNMVKYKICFNV